MPGTTNDEYLHLDLSTIARAHTKLDVIHGRHDNLDPANLVVPALDARTEGYRIFWLEGSGHTPMVEEPDRFITILDEILS